jgi:hypothetical protein
MPLDTLHTASLFKDHLLQPKHDQPALHFTNYDFGVGAILLASFAVFVWLYAANRKRLRQVVRAFYISRYTNQLGRDELTISNRITVSLSLLFVVTFSLFISQVAEYYHYITPAESTVFFFKSAVLICVTYLVKVAAVRFFGFVFQNQKEAGDYSLIVLLFCNILGLFLLPVVICMAFIRDVSPEVFIYTGAGVFATFLLIRVLRGVLIGLNSVKVSGFYLFLYLCTLEILPFVVMVKLFMINLK